MRPFVLAALGALALPASSAAATPEVCKPAAITAKLIERGKLQPGDAALGRVVSQVRCKDVTRDGRRDAVFAVASGGTAGNTNWGLIVARQGGTAGRLGAWRNGYKLALAVTGGDAEILQPVYGASDPNCCPSSFRISRFRWADQRFKLRSTRRTATAPARFRS